MSTCYRCGRPIPSAEFKLRRKVKTGESMRRRYPNPNVSAIHVHWGMRTVCSVCARIVDREEARRNSLKWIELGLALLLLAVTIALKVLT